MYMCMPSFLSLYVYISMHRNKCPCMYQYICIYSSVHARIQMVMRWYKCLNTCVYLAMHTWVLKYLNAYTFRGTCMQFSVSMRDDVVRNTCYRTE